MSGVRLNPFQSDSKVTDDITEEESISSIDSKSEEIDNDDNKTNNK